MKVSTFLRTYPQSYANDDIGRIIPDHLILVKITDFTNKGLNSDFLFWFQYENEGNQSRPVILLNPYHPMYSIIIDSRWKDIMNFFKALMEIATNPSIKKMNLWHQSEYEIVLETALQYIETMSRGRRPRVFVHFQIE